MEIVLLDDQGRLFLSPKIEDWQPLEDHDISVVFDLDGDLDTCIPTTPNRVLYIYFPIFDEELPDLSKLHALAKLGAEVIEGGHKVLSHCGMGFNRSALVAGLIMVEMGMPGPQVVARLRARRPGALFNDGFALFIESCSASAPAVT
jgi:protein-tyrosine phosphatase